MKNIRYHISRKISFALLFFLPVLSSGQEIIMTPSYYAGGYNIGCHGGNDGSINIVIVDGAAPFLLTGATDHSQKINRDLLPELIQ